MATYLKRTSKLFDISRPQASAEMNLRDLMCPVCRGILIEPVTLPCTHNLCLRCLKGTFEHNSLSCPLCRVRVGSWLRAATKSESLVNGALWELIRSRYPKEIEDKHNDDVTDIDCGTDGYTPKILSAAGEIRREYEMQLQIAEVEMRRQRESERIANEELIRKIHEDEEKQKLAQLAQDQLLAKTLAKKQLLEKEKNVKYYESLKNSNNKTNDSRNYLNKDGRKFVNSIIDETKIDAPSLLRSRDGNSLLDMKQMVESRKSNLNLLSKIQAERLALGVKPSILNKPKDPTKSYCDYSTSCHSIVTLKHQSVTMLTNKNSFNFTSEPGCSNSKIYGDQKEEELRVPSDVLNSNCNKKSIGFEIRVQSQTTTTSTNDDKRNSSAQSAGSHDSINPEIHHFKPIKAMPRTPLKISHDGRQIDPKLLRVVPVLKRISNPILKPPSKHLRRVIGCSWSAFKEYIVAGRAKQYAESECNKVDWKSPPGNSTQNHHQFAKIQMRPQTIEIARKHDHVPDVSFDDNKNHAKSINRSLNGTKMSKILIFNDNNDSDEIVVEPTKPNQSKGHGTKNGLFGKRKQKSLLKNVLNIDEMQNISPCCSTYVDTSSAKLYENVEEQRIEDDKFGAMENIAERIKRRKVTQEIIKKNENTSEKFEINRKSTRGGALSKRVVDDCIEIEEEEEEREKEEQVPSSKLRRKNVKTKGTRKNNKNLKVEKSLTLESSGRINDKRRKNGKKATRNSVRLKTCVNNDEELDDENVAATDETINVDLDKRVMQDQEHIERLVMQEKKDYELAQRLQAEFNEMERISGRTRGSKRALQRNEIAVNNIDDGKTSTFNGHSLTNNSVGCVTNAAKSRRRQKRV